MRSPVKQERAASPNCRSRRFLSGPGPACTKLWKTARSMPSDCARSLWTSRHCPRQVSSFFWGWTPATCTARRPRPPRIGRWFPLPICPRTRTLPVLARLADVEACSLLRVKSNRVFYRPAPARLPGQLGASRKDGDRFQCKDESSHGEPDETWEGLDAKGARIEVRCWNHLHLRTARWVEVSVIQIIRHGASGKARDPKISWFVWKGDRSAPLAEISPTYRLRYSQEHGYRFDKQELLWDVPRLSTPQRTERWTQIVACAHNLLVLARPLVEGCYRPWETRSSVRTLAQVRRAMPTLLHQLGTPARPPQLRGKAPGRAKGFHPKPRTRHPAIRKTSKKQKKSKKRASA